MKRTVLSMGICLTMALTGIQAPYAAAEETEEQMNVFEAPESGLLFTIPDAYKEAKGRIDFLDTGDLYSKGKGIVEVSGTYYPLSPEEYAAVEEEGAKAEEAGDLDGALDALMKMHSSNLFEIYGINEGRGKEDVIDYRISLMDPEDTPGAGAGWTEEEYAERKEIILSQIYTKIGEKDDFTYFLVTEDPERLRNEETPEGYENGYFEEYLSLVEDTDLIVNNITLTGGVELHDPIQYAQAGEGIHFETTDLEGNPVKSEDLFAGHTLTMINLWGTWCGPCKAELPELEELNKEAAEGNCQIIGIVTDAVSEDKINEAKQILKDKGVTYVNVAAFEGLEDLLPQEAYPTSYFVDENGSLIGEPVVGAYMDQYRERLLG